jgi:hypothetical protein
MTAEILRRAAALMRERAGAQAYDDAGNFLGFGGRECDEHRTVGSHRAWCYDCGEWCYPDGPCVRCASPTGLEFALAVADWLDDQLDAFLHVRPGNYLSTQKALAVARAYLGSDA